MKKIAVALFALALGTGAAWAHTGHMKEAASKKGAATTLKGEMVDMACYLGHGAHGPKHAECAKMCVLKDGAPLGVLTKAGKLYLVVQDHSDEKPYAQAKELAGADAAVTGRVVRSGGLPAIIVDKVVKL
ncbi:MAG: hypothetical protein KGM24_12330 [Elusimicrobia bacterium]|nr:hypothetical protein [Elusimicrobiota bacterium]